VHNRSVRSNPVTTTFAPCSMLRWSVASEEPSLTTMISSGGRVWRRSELIVSLMDAASLCAG
jgi:hypothetical protein